MLLPPRRRRWLFLIKIPIPVFWPVAWPCLGRWWVKSCLYTRLQRRGAELAHPQPALPQGLLYRLMLHERRPAAYLLRLPEIALTGLIPSAKGKTTQPPGVQHQRATLGAMLAINWKQVSGSWRFKPSNCISAAPSRPTEISGTLAVMPAMIWVAAS